MKIKNYINREVLDSISIFLSSHFPYSSYEILNAISQLNSIDDTIIAMYVASEQNLSLDHAIYLRLKGQDELGKVTYKFGEKAFDNIISEIRKIK